MKNIRFEHLFLSVVSLVCTSTVLATAILVPHLSAQTTENTFSDVNGDTPYHQSINFLHDRGIVGGLPDGTYAPYNFLSRSELLKIVLRAKFGDVDDTLATNCFSDVNIENWFAKYVCYAKQNGIVNGYSDGTFRPYQSVTYWEALKISLGVYNLLPEDISWSGILNHADALRVGIFSDGSNILNRGQMAGLIAHLIAYTEQGPESPYLSPYPFSNSNQTTVTDGYYVDESLSPPTEYNQPNTTIGIGIICMDGWPSPAMQRQGACSDHGGIDESRSPATTPTFESEHTWYTSSRGNATDYYCDTDNEWRNLSPTYLQSFLSQEALLNLYPNRKLNKPC